MEIPNHTFELMQIFEDEIKSGYDCGDKSSVELLALAKAAQIIYGTGSKGDDALLCMVDNAFQKWRKEQLAYDDALEERRG